MNRTKNFAALFGLLVLLIGCGEKIEPGMSSGSEPKLVKASVKIAETTSKPFIYEAVGTVHARTSSTISGKLMGTIKAIHVHEGDLVKKGDLLIEIDERQVDAELRRAEASLAEAKRADISSQSARDSAKAAAQLTSKTYERYKKLMEEDSVSRQEFEEVEAKYRQAKASLAQAESMVEAGQFRVQQAVAAVQSAKIRKKDAKVKAPYNGDITSKLVEVGDLASPGTPLLTIEKKGVFCASLVVPEKHIQSVSLGQKVKITIPSMDDKVVEGIVGRIDPAADRQSRSFTVQVGLPENVKFRSGLFARIGIPVGESGMIIIPLSAVVKRGQLEGFYLVDKKNIAHFRLLRTGRIFGDSVEVLSGIKNKDKYIAAPNTGVENGMKVEAL